MATAPPATTTAPAPAPDYLPARRTLLSARCRSAGAVAIVRPGRPPLAVGAAPARLGATAYPAGGSVVRFRRVDASGTPCRPRRVAIRSLFLLGGWVTAASVIERGDRGVAIGVRVAGRSVRLAPGRSIALGRFGRLTASAHVGRFRAALALRLLAPRARLPAGTLLLVGFSAAPAAEYAQRAVAARRRHAPKHRRRRLEHLPLTVTPPLGLRGYVFPVAGGASYGDSYGGPRADVRSGWHHGDDLFAPLGTPVVAVADGTLRLVGWERLGGWRLWLRDARGNQFYYAHLAAYSTRALRDRRVETGEVIGFLGRTGDAFTTPPHLHFEIHPRTLLRLRYDGAVDPTSYLASWPVVRPRHVPPPALPRRFPKGRPRIEAAVVWRQLLAARRPGVAHVARRTLARRSTPRVAFPLPFPLGQPFAPIFGSLSAETAFPPGRPSHGQRAPTLLWALLALPAAVLAAAAAPALIRLVRRRQTTPEPVEDAAG